MSVEENHPEKMTPRPTGSTARTVLPPARSREPRGAGQPEQTSHLAEHGLGHMTWGKLLIFCEPVSSFIK